MPADSPVLKGIDLALAGDWHAAHAVAQAQEGEPLHDWLHAILHRMEGDASNAGYWYRRAKRPVVAGADGTVELLALRAAISNSDNP